MLVVSTYLLKKTVFLHTQTTIITLSIITKTFQHGGVSMQEMMIPMLTLIPKKIDGENLEMSIGKGTL